MIYIDDYINEKNYTPNFRFFQYRARTGRGLKTMICGLDIFKVDSVSFDVLISDVAPSTYGTTNYIEDISNVVYTLLLRAGKISSPDQINWYEIHMSKKQSPSNKDHPITKVVLDWKNNMPQNPQWERISGTGQIFDISSFI